MASRLTAEQVLAVAALANLELDASEVELFARQLGDILAYADQVQQVDTRDVAPTAHVMRLHAAERDDLLAPCLDPSEALANAPDAAGLFFRVPRVIG